MVLYRKYRPQSLAELDLAIIRDRLIKTLTSSYVPHALLFAGPRGTGKTSAARIVAKILNCEKNDRTAKNHQGQKYEPCNKCEICKSITRGNHMDILEIDAASNRGIEEIRDLREKIKLAPISANYKIYIIDEVHMLTNEAFNALLKTLEEPPPHAVFILATTEPDRLPDTIRSRCMRFSFNKATGEELIHSLNRVVRGEKLKVDAKVLTAISQHADGSFRDATKILEQAYNENALTFDAISKLLGRDAIALENFFLLLAQAKTKDALLAVEKMVQGGADFRFFVSSILYTLHDLLLELHGIEQKDLPSRLKSLLDKQQVKQMITLFSRVYIELKSASRAELPLEVAIVEWCEK